MSRKIRIALAAIFFVGITLLFVGIGRDGWGWMAKLQFLPSVLALNLAVVAAILLATFLLGRIYCSVICPMGVFQDLILWLRRTGGKRFKKQKSFSYVKADMQFIIRIGFEDEKIIREVGFQFAKTRTELGWTKDLADQAAITPIRVEGIEKGNLYTLATILLC